MRKSEEKSEDEYNELSEEKKAKYTQVPKDALVEENIKTLVSTALPDRSDMPQFFS